MTRVLRGALAGRGFFPLGVTVGGWLLTTAVVDAQGRWDRSCYGDTVEVTLVSELTGEPKVPL